MFFLVLIIFSSANFALAEDISPTEEKAVEKAVEKSEAKALETAVEHPTPIVNDKPAVTAQPPAHLDIKNTTEEDLWKKHIAIQLRLKEEEQKLLLESNLEYEHQATAASLARLSNKPLSEIIRMGHEQNLDWPKLATTLGVDKKAMKKSVASLKKEVIKEKRENLKKLQREASKKEKKKI